ncbi:MAG: hypothetical protein HY204_05790 [Nitrospirae bacterium]|nr:hypothetical protein [Nitrospirota bacterium]
MTDRIIETDDLRPVAEVVLFKQLDRVFHYAVPEAFRDRLEPGMRVRVPFRNDYLTGIVVRRLRRADGIQLKPILDVLDSAPLLDRSMMALARWIAEYYVTGWGVAMKAILPPGLEVTAGRHYRITQAGRDSISIVSKKGSLEQQILAVLERSPRGLRLEALTRRIKTDEPRRLGGRRPLSRPLSVLIQKGWIEETRVLPRRRPSPNEAFAPPDNRQPLYDQETADPSVPEDLYRAVRSGRFATFCLEGEPERSGSAVTALAYETIRRGRSAILLVPEIGRVSGWVERLKNQLGVPIGTLHSGLSDRERRAEWERIRSGDIPVVVGTRLAVFAPLPNPGLIVVEEEQYPAYKQEESPRYHARDVAVLRARHHQALALLTSASPSVETYANIQNGKYRSVRLDEPKPKPTVRIMDLAGRPRETFVSDELLAAVTARLDKKEPVVLLLNRRGFGTALYCRDCGAVVGCPRCRVAMVYYRGLRRPLHRRSRVEPPPLAHFARWDDSKRDRQLSCSYCGTTAVPPTACTACRGTHLKILGVGTERVEDFFRARFPSARIARLDRDTARPGDAADALERLDHSQLDLVIGTQLLLKGPGMTRPGLIGLLLADGAFHLPDFRASEQTFQLIRRILTFSTGGEVILQTYHPTHESIA